MFKVKIKGNMEYDETSYYKVYAIDKKVKIEGLHQFAKEIITTEFLIHNGDNGFHWVDACYCTPV